jgi:DNA (cytosine-5)-methyltransferase 1
MNYYNEWDKDAAAWIRELIKAGLVPNGDVDERSITEIKAHELTSYNQCHFFAGIGGWPLAFAIAGVGENENADSGSCPCQPFSGTGKQMGFSDPRHLWPAFRRIETRRQPAKIYGEQVASKLGREWLSRVFSDLEIMGYAGSGADLCSAGVGSPNIRQRLYWVGDAEAVRCGTWSGESLGENSDRGDASRSIGDGRMAQSNRITGSQGSPLAGGGAERGDAGQEPGLGSGGYAHRLGHAMRTGSLSPAQPAQNSTEESRGARDGISAGSSPVDRLGYADHARREGRLIRWDGGYERAAGETSVAGPATLRGFWGVADLVFCRDEKWRRIEPGSFPLAHGIPSRVGPLLTELRKLGRSSISLARANRNIRLKGYGNAINPYVAAAFIAADRADVLGRVTVAPAEPQPLCLDE